MLDSDCCTSINRNILECKYIYCRKTNSLKTVLIETYWNVNLEAVVIVIISGSCINRNILECKFLRVVVQAIQPVGINRNILECK